MSTKINLLPWREAARKRREREFYVMLGIAAAIGAGIWFAVHTHLAGRIDYQERRNDLLRQEIAKLDRQIVKIRELEETKERLIARMNVIQELQQGRPQIVHLFQQFVATLPQGLYLSTLREKGDDITITGVAESNARVSSYMENLEGSPWLQDPDLTVIEVRDRNGHRVSDFTLTVQQTPPNTTENGDESEGAG
ncbi:PilN domain-containing protein [Arhodomonas sp. AD133]|uniref:PilN domain-containing protein n=1 Tax=Arhodomonas sp. AD133 TaxID=3415009 RepID=UPI003EBD541A